MPDGRGVAQKIECSFSFSRCVGMSVYPGVSQVPVPRTGCSPCLCTILRASPLIRAGAARMPAHKYACILTNHYSENVFQWENGNILHLISQTLHSTS